MSLGSMRRPMSISYIMQFGLNPNDVLMEYMDNEGYWSATNSKNPVQLWYVPDSENAPLFQKWYHLWPDGFDYNQLLARMVDDDAHRNRRNLHARSAS